MTLTTKHKTAPRDFLMAQLDKQRAQAIKEIRA